VLFRAALDQVTPLPHTVLAELPAVPESIGALRRKAREAAERCGADDQVVADVTLAVSEAATNAVVHGYREAEPGTLALAAETVDGEMHLEVIDDGSGLVPRPDSPGLGLGLPVIARVTDRFEVCPGPRGHGTRLFMAFRVAA
jgi:anti-sigma regulatory factor (Ser/Thr protein kinase)